MPNRIKELREDRGLSQEQLAQRAIPKTTKAQISKLERDERKLTVTWARRLAPALECHWAELFNEGLTRDESEMVEAYRGLSEDRRALARRLITTLEDDR